MWLKLLNISSVITLCILCLSCKKEKHITMKTGYYDVVEVKTFQNGNEETDTFTVLGSYTIKSETNRYYFTRNKTDGTISYSFLTEAKTSTDTQISTNSKTSYKITELEASSTELTVKRSEINDSLISNIHFKYIE